MMPVYPNRSGAPLRVRRLLVSTLLLGALVAPGPDAAAQQPAAERAPEAELPLLTLQQALATAREQNADVRIARNDARIAENNHSLGNAGYLPTIGVTAQRSQRPISPAQPQGLSTGTLDLATTMGYTVFDGFRREQAYRRFGALERQAGIAAERTTERVMAEVGVLYFDLVRQQQQLEVLRESIDISEERLRIAEQRLEVGSGSELQVRQAQVDLNADRAALLRQRVGLTSARSRFNILLGRDGSAAYRVADSIPLYDVPLGEATRAEAVERNRDVRIAAQAREVAELERRGVRGEWLPTVGLQVGYGFADLSDRFGYRSTMGEGVSVGVTLGLSLFDGLNRDRRLSNARLNLASRELALRQTQSALVAEMEATEAEFRNRRELVELEEDNVRLARANVEVALERFRLGLSTSVELREVQNALSAARSRAVASRYEAKAAEIGLLRLRGALLEERP